ncbi:MAG TPA: hypothetical protein VE487_15825 [Ilumatobacter sp.]|nr:hypothetical protein [Ilumatobacter sp.]
MSEPTRLAGLRLRLTRILAVVGLATLTLGVQSGSTAPASAPSTIVTVDPARILDTREPIGAPAAAPVGPDSSITVQVAGVGGVPLDATGVIVTLTATEGTADTFITATPTGTPRATTSVLNPGVSKAIANTITIGLGDNGRIDLYNKSGSVHLVADVTGYLVPKSPAIETGAIELTGYSAMASTPVGPVRDSGCVDLGDTGDLVLDIPLDHGMAITSFTFHYFDDDTANMTFVLFEIDDLNGGKTTNGTLAESQTASTGTAGYGRATVTPVGADKVSSTVRYVAHAFTLGQAGPQGVHAFCGATVNWARETTS